MKKNQTLNNKIVNNINADFFKISKYKSIWISLIVIFAIILIVFAISMTTTNLMKNSLDSMSPEDRIETEAALAMNTGKDLLYTLFNLSSSMIQILCAIIICIFVGNEFQTGMSRTYIARGCSRVSYYFSKLITIATLTMCYCIFALILSGIFAAINGYGIEFTGKEFGILMRSFILQYLTMMSFLSICLMFAFLFRSTGTSIGAGIGIYIAFDLVISILLVLLNVRDANTDWVNFLPLQQQSIASSYFELRPIEIVAVSVMPIVYITLSSLIGVFSFLKRDIK